MPASFTNQIITLPKLDGEILLLSEFDDESLLNSGLFTNESVVMPKFDNEAIVTS